MVGAHLLKAIVQDTYGSPDVLELRDIDKPVVGDNDVLLRIHAAGVNPGVWHAMTGLPYLMRIMGCGDPIVTLFPVLGTQPGGGADNV